MRLPAPATRSLTAARPLGLGPPRRSATTQRVATQSRRWASSSTSTEELKKTPLYEFNVQHGGKMVPFAGYQMPVQFGGVGLSESHRFTRSHASLFDVSHMVQHVFRGPGAAAFLETVTPSSVTSLGPFQSRLSAFLWPDTGGIVDDTMITRVGEDAFNVVTNAGVRDKDLAYIADQLEKLGFGQEIWKVEDNSGLIALQGPLSGAILAKVLATEGVDIKKFYFGHTIRASLRLPDGSISRELSIARGGYTGEDGFEISLVIPDGEGDVVSELTAITNTLLDAAGDDLKLAGLGARDSLRLEAGMCLYGHDLDDSTTPVEAGLSWIIPPERRKQGGFHGADNILAQLVPKSKGGKGVERRRVGLIVEGAPAREGVEIRSKDGEKAGIVTSGSPSPTLGKNIAMGYVRDGLHKAGTEVDVVVRGKARKAVVTKMPFVTTQYYKGE